MVVDSKATCRAKRLPIAGSTKPDLGGNYRPSYVPPAPVVPVKKKSVIKVDISGVHTGTIVTHNAIGTGEVKGIDGSRIVVRFKGKDKISSFLEHLSKDCCL